MEIKDITQSPRFPVYEGKHFRINFDPARLPARLFLSRYPDNCSLGIIHGFIGVSKDQIQEVIDLIREPLLDESGELEYLYYECPTILQATVNTNSKYYSYLEDLGFKEIFKYESKGTCNTLAIMNYYF